jgi:hypothetical protein
LATVLVEPFVGAAAQGIVLMFAQQMNQLSFGHNQRLTQIRALGIHAEESELSAAFAGVEMAGIDTDAVTRFLAGSGRYRLR